MTVKKEKVLEIERGSTRSRDVEISLWKGLWICRKADYVLMTNCAAMYTPLLIKCDKAELWVKTW